MAKSNSKAPTKKAQQAKHKSDKTTSGKKLKPAEQKVLDIVAGLKSIGKQEAPRKQVFSMASMGKSTFANALTTLKNGFLDVTPNTLSITDMGMKHADPDAVKGSVTMTNEDHHEKIKEHFKLKPNARALIDALADGQVKDKKEVVAKIGMKMNSTFANMQTDLKNKAIIVFSPTTIQLHDDMFPFGRPE